MDQDNSLLWHGPVWFAGRPSPVSAGSIPGLPGDIDLLQSFAGAENMDDRLPSAVIVDTSSIAEADRDRFFAWLDGLITRLPTDVPVLFLSGPDDVLPGRPKANATINRTVPDDVLFDAICSHQRALMRFEEARIRRLVFGRIPGYGAAPHYRGTSGLLVVGLGGRFPELQEASGRKVEVIGAFTRDMAENYLSQRAFDAVILDSTLGETLESLRQIRMDSRFAAIPVLVVTDQPGDTAMLFKAGANDVLALPLDGPNLRARLATAIRHGKRRRLADKVLAESHRWLTQQLDKGGLSQNDYFLYLERAGQALAVRGLALCEMKLLPENFVLPEQTTALAENLFGTLLSVADATSREEDLVCVVNDIGPVAVLKSQRGKGRLQARIEAILGHTAL
jgi:DNA-binding response OmpR family regulator